MRNGKQIEGDHIKYRYLNLKNSSTNTEISIHINYRQRSIITKDIKYGLYKSHSLKKIKIAVSSTSSASRHKIKPLFDPLAPIPPKDKACRRVDFALYYRQTGMRQYENKEGKRKFMQFIE